MDWKGSEWTRTISTCAHIFHTWQHPYGGVQWVVVLKFWSHFFLLVSLNHWLFPFDSKTPKLIFIVILWYALLLPLPQFSRSHFKWFTSICVLNWCVQKWVCVCVRVFTSPSFCWHSAPSLLIWSEATVFNTWKLIYSDILTLRKHHLSQPVLA